MGIKEQKPIPIGSYWKMDWGNRRFIEEKNNCYRDSEALEV